VAQNTASSETTDAYYTRLANAGVTHFRYAATDVAAGEVAVLLL